MIDMTWIRELVELVDESGVDSVEISRFGTHVKVRKSPPAPPASPPPPPAPSNGAGAGGASAAAPAPTAEPQPAAEPTEEVAEEAPPDEELYEVESPMVGTFYRAPAPDAPPYVEVGDHVSQGQTLCILEAMKLMNELEAEVSGTIREICVQNAEPVEYGQVLFRVEPD